MNTKHNETIFFFKNELFLIFYTINGFMWFCVISLRCSVFYVGFVARSIWFCVAFSYVETI